MTLLRRLAYLALGVAVTQILFGAIVRISGSGMGCGNNWPKCFGSWFPPLDQPTLVIEWTHRLLALLVSVAVVVLALAAIAASRRISRGAEGRSAAGGGERGERAVAGRGGVLRPALLAVGIVVVTAFFGMITVRLGNVWYATVVHWLLAATLVATLAAVVIRSGGFGGASARMQHASPRAARGAVAAAAIALVVIAFGGMTANFPGASAACTGFPFCGGSTVHTVPAQHVQMTHRILAFILFFHVIGLTIGFARRREAPVVVRTVGVALALIVLQVVVAAGMVGMHLPAPMRSLHQALGLAIWLSLFTLAYLARIASRSGVWGSMTVDDDTAAGVTRRSSRMPMAPIADATRTTTGPSGIGSAPGRVQGVDS